MRSVSVDEVTPPIPPARAQPGWHTGLAHGTPIALALAGLLMATSAATAQGTDLRSDRRSDLADLIREQAAKAAVGAASVQDLRAQVDRLTAAGGGSDAGVAAAAQADGTARRARRD